MNISRKVKRNKFFPLIVIIVFIVVFVKTYSGKKSDLPQEKRTSTLIWGSIGDASLLNPILATDSASGDISGLVFNGLVKYDKDLELVGDLAGSWDISEDNLVMTFHLRKGVKWHDGEEFDSEDVLYTFQALRDPNTRTPYSSKYDRVTSLETPDRYTVVVTYSEPFSPALSSWGMGILPQHLYANTDINENPHNRDPVGTGPYKFVSWSSDDRIILKAFKGYFEGKPGIDRVIYKIVPDQAVQFMELNREAIDWMSPTPDQWVSETSKEEFKAKFHRFRYPTFSFAYMGYNLSNELFKDVRVRHAINLAIDKQKIIDGVLQGLGSVANGPYPPVSWAYNSDIKDPGYQREEAVKLLNQAGWKYNEEKGLLQKDGKTFSFTIMTNQGNSVRKLTTEIIQSQLKALGMDVKVRIQEWSSFIHQYVDKKQFDAVLLGWSLSVDPDGYSIWHSSQQEEGQYNFVGYSNPEVDRLLIEGRRVFDIDKRKAIYKRIHEILHADQPYLFLYFADSKHAIHNRFQNISVEKSGISHNFIEWYVPEERIKY